MQQSRSKPEITAAVLGELQEMSQWSSATVSTVMKKWWMAANSNSSFRLTDDGATAFGMAGISHYDFTLTTDPMLPKSFHVLARMLRTNLKTPYYLGVASKKTSIPAGPYLRIYDSKAAMMITFHEHVSSYLNSVSKKH